MENGLWGTVFSTNTLSTTKDVKPVKLIAIRRLASQCIMAGGSDSFAFAFKAEVGVELVMMNFLCDIRVPFSHEGTSMSLDFNVY